MNPDELDFDASTFSQNQTRLLQHQVADLFFSEVVELAQERGRVSNEHFSVDGTLVKAWASLKSFKPKGTDRGPGDGNGTSNLRRQKRWNATHESTTDPEAKLPRMGDGRKARLRFGLHAAMENRHGLCVHLQLTSAVGFTETEAAQGQLDELSDRGFDPRRVGADRGYHNRGFVQGCRQRAIIPPRSCRRWPSRCSRRLYRQRHTVENFFARIKCYRRIATSYEKLADHYLGFLLLTAVLDWLKLGV